MDKPLLLGFWRKLLRIPRAIWQKQVKKMAEETEENALAFMSDEHHRVRDFVVLELPRAGNPLSPELIANRLSLPVERVVQILDELEKHMTFVFRDGQGAVEWAYPVTAAQTPHRVTFSTDETIYAA